MFSFHLVNKNKTQAFLRRTLSFPFLLPLSFLPDYTTQPSVRMSKKIALQDLNKLLTKPRPNSDIWPGEEGENDVMMEDAASQESVGSQKSLKLEDMFSSMALKKDENANLPFPEAPKINSQGLPCPFCKKATLRVASELFLPVRPVNLVCDHCSWWTSCNHGVEEVRRLACQILVDHNSKCAAPIGYGIYSSEMVLICEVCNLATSITK